MTPRTGRPKEEDARHKREVIRFNAEELEKLQYCAKVTGKAKAEIIREGISRIYQELIQKQK